jgi:hypothetical protein
MKAPARWSRSRRGSASTSAPKELERAIGENQLAKIQKEAEKLRVKAQQLALFSEIDEETQKRLADLDAELGLRRGHYEQVQDRLAVEAERTLKQCAPPAVCAPGRSPRVRDRGRDPTSRERVR